MPGKVAAQNKPSRRDKILEVSLDLFLEKGYESTPVHEIAEVIGTSHSNIHYHFKHKKEILQTLFQPSFERVEALLHQEKGRTEILEGYLEIMLDGRKLAALMVTDLSVRSIPDIRQHARELMDGLRAKVAEGSTNTEEQMRAECALGILRSGVVSFPDSDAETVRGVTLPAARAVLALR